MNAIHSAITRQVKLFKRLWAEFWDGFCFHLKRALSICKNELVLGISSAEKMSRKILLFQSRVVHLKTAVCAKNYSIHQQPCCDHRNLQACTRKIEIVGWLAISKCIFHVKKKAIKSCRKLNMLMTPMHNVHDNRLISLEVIITRMHLSGRIVAEVKAVRILKSSMWP